MLTHSSAELIPTTWSPKTARPTCAPALTTPGMARSSPVMRATILSISVREVAGEVSTWITRYGSLKRGSACSRLRMGVTIRPATIKITMAIFAAAGLCTARLSIRP
jgi:hypothetical protein